MRTGFVLGLLPTTLASSSVVVSSRTAVPTTSTACQQTSIATLSGGAHSTRIINTNGTCSQATSLSSAAIYTPAPWLESLPQTIVTYIESFIFSQSTVYKTFSFAVPQPTAFASYIADRSSVVTVSVLSCPSNGAATTIVPGKASAAATTQPLGAAPAVLGVQYITTVLTSTYSTVYTSLSSSTITEYYTNAVGATTSSSVHIQTVTSTSTVIQPTTVTLTSTVVMPTTTSTSDEAIIGATARGSSALPTALVEASDAPFATIVTPASLQFSNSSSDSITSAIPSLTSKSTGSSSGVLGNGSPNTLFDAATSSASSSASQTSARSGVSHSGAGPSSTVRASPSPSSSASASSNSACPIGTIATSATAPAPPAGTNVYNISGNAPYSIAEADLLSMISFPNGFNCKNKLVILQPGTAVPAIDTYSNTFIPVFEQDVVTGGVDIMLVSNPSISLAPAWETAEYIAYAMDYAHLVLNRPGTIIAWSQGNLNVQWAFKYWPSTRTDVTGRNYVGMSPDYDGTILGTFLCEPVSILTAGSGETLLDEFITEGGLASVLALLGINEIPSVDGTTDPVAFKALLDALVFTDAASGNSSTASGSASVIPSSVASQTPIPSPTGNASAPAITSPVALRRAVPFGDRKAIAAKLEARMMTKRNTLEGALGDLLDGVLSPIATELASIVVDPTADLMQVFANLAKLVTDPVQLSLPPAGCAPSVWDQAYMSPFILKLAENSGALAYVPTTTVFSITDEVVQPQGITGYTDASGYLSGANEGVVAPENIFIQNTGQCSVISAVADLDVPPIITHEGVLNSGMGVAAAILAVNSGSTVSYDQIVAAYGMSEACALVSQYSTGTDLLGNEATIPGALERVTISPGTSDPDAQFVSAEVPLPAYSADF